jgi:hypothetical protein
MIEWLSAPHIDVTGTAKPGEIAGPYNDNRVAAIRITSQFEDYGLVIEGRPEVLLQKAREILRTAELIVEQTMRDPNLRSLYGITSVEHGGTDLNPVLRKPVEIVVDQETAAYIERKRASGMTDAEIVLEALDAEGES